MNRSSGRRMETQMNFWHDKYILIADSHLEGGTEKASRFFRMLDTLAARKPAGIIFLGDIFELWIALDGYEIPEQKRFTEWCRAHLNEMEIGFIEGNHEFFVSATHADAFSWITDRYHDLHGTVRLMHGDTVNRRDWKYLLLRRAIRNAFTKFLLILFARTIGPAVADRIRLSLKTSNMAHKKYLPRKELESCAGQCAAQGIVSLAAGHFHAWNQFNPPAGPPVTILPAWDNEKSVALLDCTGNVVLLPPGESPSL